MKNLLFLVALLAISKAPTASAQTLDLDSRTPEQKYESDAIKLGTQSFVFFNAHSGQVLGGGLSMVFMRGGWALSGAAFYNVIGRRDLAEQYSVRRKRKIALFAAGSAMIPVAVGVGFGVMFSDPYYRSDIDAKGYSIVRKESPVYLGTGIALTVGLAAAGIGMISAGVAMNADPMSYPEKRRAAEKYNEDLRRSLGLASLRTALRSATVTPSFDGRQLTLQVAGKF